MKLSLVFLACASVASPAFACWSNSQCAATPGTYCDIGDHPGGEGQCVPGDGSAPAGYGTCYSDSNCQVFFSPNVPYSGCYGSSWSDGDGFCYGVN